MWVGDAILKSLWPFLSPQQENYDNKGWDWGIEHLPCKLSGMKFLNETNKVRNICMKNIKRDIKVLCNIGEPLPVEAKEMKN